MKKLTKQAVLKDTNMQTMWSVFRYIMDNNDTDIIVRKGVDKLVIIYKGIQYNPFKAKLNERFNLYNNGMNVLSKIEYKYSFHEDSGLQIYTLDINHARTEAYILNPTKDIRVVRSTALLIYEEEMSNDEMEKLNGEDKFLDALSWYHELILNILCYNKEYKYYIKDNEVRIYHEDVLVGRVPVES